ncbi:chromosome segregation ATPase [Clostridium beijerinckii]|nr:chromosome segregation ATPase [Clostridium beijerinckii]
MQLQKKQRFMDDYEERIAIILEQKRKTDENYNVFIELQQNLQKEFDDTKKQLDDAKKQLNEAKDQLLKEKDIRISIEKKLLELENENLIIRQKVMTINEEKNKLYEDLEFERNQSIMERLLRKKPSGI